MFKKFYVMQDIEGRRNNVGKGVAKSQDLV